jgi:hypothetical protein
LSSGFSGFSADSLGDLCGSKTLNAEDAENFAQRPLRNPRENIVETALATLKPLKL